MIVPAISARSLPRRARLLTEAPCVRATRTEGVRPRSIQSARSRRPRQAPALSGAVQRSPPRSARQARVTQRTRQAWTLRPVLADQAAEWAASVVAALPTRQEA